MDFAKIFVQILDKLPMTLLMVVVSLIFAVIIGFLTAIIRINRTAILAPVATVYISFMRGTPMLIQLFLIYFGLPQLLLALGIDINGWHQFVFLVLAFSLHTGAYLSEVFRSAYLAVGREQLEAAYAVGMTYPQALRRIILPQSFQYALPNLGNNIIELFKDTSLAFTIGMIDLMGQARIIIGNNHGTGYFEVYLAISVVYWLVCTVIEIAVYKLESLNKYRKEIA
ncbi:MAG: amino acid ABC transporter permease [Solibacillus sp.]